MVLEYAPGTILYLVIVFGTIRLLMIMKKMDMELVDRTPIYLSLTMLVFYTVIFIADWVNISDFNFTWFMLANFLKLSAGFVNFLVGYKRTKKVVDELNETPKGITIESNQTSLMYRNDLTSYLNYTES